MSTSNPYAAPQARKIDVQEARKVETPAEPQVPVGSISEVLQWVGDDAERAVLALDYEKANLGRKTLVGKLTELIGVEDVEESDETADDTSTEDETA